MKSKLWMIVLVVGMIAFSAVVWYSDKQKSSNEIQSLKQEITTLNNKNSDLELQNQKLSDAYDELFKEKNGTAKEKLLNATDTLFSALFNYDTRKESESVKARKESASKLTEERALETVFPKDADKITPSVTTISKLDKTPSVYLMSSDEKTQVAIVEVNYAISIAGSEEQTGTLFYKIAYDPLNNKFTEIKNVGEVNL